jgi:hypothetical protein
MLDRRDRLRLPTGTAFGASSSVRTRQRSIPARKQVFARPVLHLRDYWEPRTPARPSTM